MKDYVDLQEVIISTAEAVVKTVNIGSVNNIHSVTLYPTNNSTFSLDMVY